jgi:hypothetical protein
LLACNLGNFDPEYIDWQGNYENYDLHTDTMKELSHVLPDKANSTSMDGYLFSTCKVYPTKMNPDPLNKVDDGDRGVGALWITIDHCSDLLASDANGKSDPSVKMSYEEMTWITATVQNDLSPVFDEDFRVPLWTLPRKGDASKQVVLEVSDEDDYFGMKTDFLGKVELDMATLVAECEAAAAHVHSPRSATKVTKILPLLNEEGGDHTTCKKGPRGTITLIISWHPHRKVFSDFGGKEELVPEGSGTSVVVAQEAKEVGAEPALQQYKEKRSVGYVQDMSKQQLTEEINSPAAGGRRFMV